MNVEITPIYEAWTNERRLLITWREPKNAYTLETRCVKTITLKQETIGM